jgi:site-specific DNA recombinase
MQFDGYIRVSDKFGRGESYITKDAQRGKIERWASLHDHEILSWEVDEDQPGGKLVRPGLDRILERIRAGQTGGIAVARIDRLSRAGVGDAMLLVEDILEHGGKLASVEQNIDPTTVMGEFVLTMMLALARMERQRIGENWGSARKEALKRKVQPTTTPFGYRRVCGVCGGSVTPGKLTGESGYQRARCSECRQTGTGRYEPDPIAGPLVTEMYERRAAGASWICRWLNGAGITSKHGATWTASKLRALLRKRCYLGEATDGVEVCEGAHPPLTDRVTWETVQQLHGPRGGKRREGSALLSGLVRCAGCRYMTVPLVNRGNSRHGSWHYRCTRAQVGCPGPVQIAQTGVPHAARGGHRIDGLDEFVVKRVFKRLPDFEVQGFGANDDLEDLDAAVKRTKAEFDAFASDTEAQEALGREGWLLGAQARRTAWEEAQQLYNEAVRKAGPMMGLRTLADDWKMMTVDEKRTALKTVIRYVFVRQADGSHGASADRVHIVWADDPEVDVPRQGRRDYTPRPFTFPDDAHNPGGLGEAVA